MLFTDTAPDWFVYWDSHDARYRFWDQYKWSAITDALREMYDEWAATHIVS